MREHELSRIAMACFVEGIDPPSLALSPGHLARVEALLADISGHSDTDRYWRCLEALSSDSSEEAL
ncbi:MAG: hypothetical protein RL518_2581 [Pseudomonadota bacterium]|jgi:hypothetical protein